MALLRFVGWRILKGAVTLGVFLFVTYLAVGTFIPNDANSLFPVMTPGELEAYRARLGLERPLAVQFLIWLRGLVSGDLGRTTFGAPIASRIGDATARSLFVIVIGLPAAYVFGAWLGRRSGWRRRVGTDSTTILAVVLGTTFPPFLAFVLTYVLREQTSLLADLRTTVVGDPRQLWSDTALDQTDVLWLIIASFLVAAVLVTAARRIWPMSRRVPASIAVAAVAAVATAIWFISDLERNAADLLVTAAVPLLAFTALSFGEFMVISQAATAAHRREDFVMVARAKGLPARRVRDVHGSSSARLVMLSRLAISLPYLMTGLVIIEQAVAWPGLGDFLFQALQGRDLPTIMSSLLVIGVFTLISRTALDVLQRVLDPRLAVDGLPA